jgi:hypothetical protein
MRALERWGYETEARAHVFDQRIDVIAHRERPNNEPSDWIVALCRDWEDEQIPASLVVRLCMLAFTCRAMPLLCHMTSLTREAARLARNWEVRVVSFRDFQRGALPGPQVVDFWDSDMKPSHLSGPLRECRGEIPSLMKDGPFTGLSYVPGYEPVGDHGRYRPVTISRDK